MARPTELTEQTIKAGERFLRERGNMDYLTLLPTIEGLALACDIHRDTVYEWAKPIVREDPKAELTDEEIAYADLRAKFSDIVRRVHMWQAEKTIQNSLMGRYNSSTSGLILAKHGYAQKQVLAGDPEAPLASPYAQLTSDQLRKLAEDQPNGADAADKA